MLRQDFGRIRRVAWRVLAGILTVALLVPSLVLPVEAQQSGGMSADQLQQLQQLYQQRQGQSSGSGLDSQSPANNSLTLQPAVPSDSVRLPPSRLEQIMSSRAGVKLRQFGYDQLGSARAVTVPQTGAIQDDYVLGPGDEIVVSLRGQENSEFRAPVDRNGQVLLPRLSPVPAMGRDLGSFRADVEAAVHRAYVATNAFVTVSRVRQISVLVSGEVTNPGLRLVTGLSSVVDALLLSGGVKKTGSLRDIRVEHGGRARSIDLYGLLTGSGGSPDLKLADGDRIVVPPLGRTVAVTGLVRQPGIFELPSGQGGIAARRLLALAGGQEVRGRYRLSALRILADGRSDLAVLPNEASVMRDSEILFVQLGADLTTSQATLSGGTGLAGQYPIGQGAHLSDILRAPGALGEQPYTLFGIIGRKDARTYLRTLTAFTPVAVLGGTEDQALRSDDIVRVLTVGEMRLINATAHLYVQRQDDEQKALRDPLGDAASNPGSNGQGQTVAVLGTSSRSASDRASDQLSDIQRLGSLTQRQLDMISTGQAKLDDFRFYARQDGFTGSQGAYLPAEMQAFQQGLPQQGLPQTAGLQPGMAQPGMVQPGAMQPGQVPPYGYGQGMPLSPQGGMAYGANGMMQQPGMNSNGETQGAGQPPPANFQEQPDTNDFPSNREAPTFNALARQLGVEPLVLVNFLLDHAVTMDGAVRGPGSYFVGPNVALQDLVQAAGGTVNWADESSVELLSTAVDPETGRSATRRAQMPLHQGMLASYVVKPHDEFRFNQVFTDALPGTVAVQGEVRFTGTYQLRRGDHLSELMARAGGLTAQAYPYGTVFLRKSVADKERDSYIRAAKDIEDQLVVAMTRVGNDKIPPETFASMQSFVNDLRNQKAVGRVSIVADPSVLAAQPELDPLLETGDVIYIPQRPSTISVLGQVMQPGSFPYRAGSTLQDYIERAGGYSVTADDSSTYIVLPDGTARKVERSWLSVDTNQLPPGSAIVVPRDVTPLDLRQTIIDVSQIFSQFAVAIASIAVLSKQ